MSDCTKFVGLVRALRALNLQFNTAIFNTKLDVRLHQIRLRPGLRPGPCWGSLRRSPRPLVGFVIPYTLRFLTYFSPPPKEILEKLNPPRNKSLDTPLLHVYMQVRDICFLTYIRCIYICILQCTLHVYFCIYCM